MKVRRETINSLGTVITTNEVEITSCKTLQQYYNKIKDLKISDVVMDFSGKYFTATVGNTHMNRIVTKYSIKYQQRMKKIKVKKDEWDAIVYDGITAEENEIIRTARREGFAVFYPCYENQGVLTLKGAKEFLSKKQPHRDAYK